MKPITLYTRSLNIVHKHSICSAAAFLVAILAVGTVVAPIYITFALNGNLWLTEGQQRVQHQQPTVRFPFQYILLGEYNHQQDALAQEQSGNQEEATEVMDINNKDYDVDSGNATEEQQISVITSYMFLNNLIPERHQQSVSIEHWTSDVNHDDIAEQIHLEFLFEPPIIVDRLSFLSLYLALTAQVNSAQTCYLHLPAAVIIDRLPLSAREIIPGTDLFLSGRLRFYQKSPFNCPNLIRKRQTYFQHRDPIPTNSTSIEDFSFNTIADRLGSNVGYLMFELESLRSKPSDEGNGHVRLKVAIAIDEIEVRYWSSIGQQLFRVWMEYLAVIIVLAVVADNVKAFMFGRFWVRSWEVMPSKKNY